MKTTSNDPISPCKGYDKDHNDKVYNGLTKLEYFSGIALQGILANPNYNHSVQDAQKDAIGWAYSLIGELNKQSQSC